MTASLIRSLFLEASRSDCLSQTIERAPFTRTLVRRFVAGECEEDAIRVASALIDEGFAVTLDHLGENAHNEAEASAATQSYLTLLSVIRRSELADRAEVSIKLSAIGHTVDGDGHKLALANAREICAAAVRAGTQVTIDMEDHTTTDATLRTVEELRADFPKTGAVLQAYLRRTERDCEELAHEGSRVRLCKGAYDEPTTVAYANPHDTDLAYVRCMKRLFAGQGYPMIATHDPRLVEIAEALATRFRREQGSYEYQMLYGVRTAEQRRLVRSGERVRVYVPYGRRWYPYLMRRLAERPANVSLFLRSVVTKR